ncbi:class A beta-lactamase-related serine hydrolase [Arenibacter aquaticus]|uniref:Class A beta-lactamase-related serine hydrolase n=1 Tax=Arenibacter aquaticus TaxID=2489054 RepID=A0A3S0CRL7_9FLAO|nr:serine hydrolase domain-containing protein [Arenibacter aquaticus]RTE55483.1 class A beta-lactamase-related serine hydrolase [Arenibacter aquaticus]
MKNTILLILCITVSFLCNGQQNVGTTLDEYLNRAESLGFSGAVMLYKDGETLLNKGYGYADRGNKKKNTAYSVFSTGSLTKQFTAAAIMKLEMMGKLKTTDKLSVHFAQVPQDKVDINLHHLLTHTSGLKGAIGGDFNWISKEDYLKQALNSDLKFNPGENFNYSNVGYSLLAIIIEKLSGVDYEEFLNTHLFTPAGMDKTGYSLPKWDKSNFVHIYNGNKNNGSTERFTKPTWHLKGNGGILSTTSDMVKWIKALKTEEILSNKAKEKMWTPYKNDYGYGWDVLDDGALRQHDGGSTIGLSAELRWFVQDNIITMLFTNATINGKLGFTVVRGDIEALAMGEKIPLPPKFKTVEANTKNLSGTYQLPSGQHFKIKDNSGTIALMVDNQELLDIISDPENYGPDSPAMQLNEKFHNAFDKAFKENDYSGFSFTQASKILEREIKNEIKMEGFQNPKYKVVKSFLSQNNKNAYVTQVALSDDPDFDDECLILSLITENGHFAGLGANFDVIGPIELSLYPIGENKLQAYNLDRKMGALLSITPQKDHYLLKVNNTEIPNVKKVK